MQQNRLAKAEDQLSGRQRVLAWMHRRQQVGGFVEMVTRDMETNLASSAPVVIKDLEAAFVFHCVHDCNIRVLELNGARLEKGLLSLCLKHFLNPPETPPEDWEIATFRRALKVFVLKWKLFERAAQMIGEEHFSGMRVLYKDTALMLEKGLEDAEILVCGFNVKMAPRLGIEPITSKEIEEYLQAAASREADRITSLARAKAELAFGNRLSACPLIVEAIRLAEPHEGLSRLQAQ